MLDDTGPTEKLEHGRGEHALCRGRHRGAIQFVRRAEETERLDTTTGGSLPLNLTYSLVKEHLVLRRQPLDRSSSTVTGFARRTRVSVPGHYEADLFEFGRRTATDRIGPVVRIASPTVRQ